LQHIENSVEFLSAFCRSKKTGENDVLQIAGRKNLKK